MSLVRLVARPMLASVFIVEGIKTLLAPDKYVPAAQPMADKMRPMVERYAPQLPSDTRALVQLTAATQLGGGLLLATGRMPRVASLILFGSLIPTTLAHHAFWRVEDPEQRAEQRMQFQKNVGMAGGLLLAGVDTAGRPGLAWRAQHATKQAQHATKTASSDAKRVAKRARREARLAKREAKLAARAAKAEVAKSARDFLH